VKRQARAIKLLSDPPDPVYLSLLSIGVSRPSAEAPAQFI